MNPPDFLTILKAEPGRRATKIHTRDGETWRTQGYDAGCRFDVYQEQLGDIFEMRRLLDRLERRADCYVIRGRLIAGRPVKGVHRWHRTEGHPANFEAVDHRWLLCDLDGPASPSWLDPNDPESLRRAVEWARDTYLPDAFRGVTVAYQWSRSAGVKPWSGLRLALWFWTNRPACDASLKRWLTGYCDACVFTPTQPHYTAAPVFVGGADPLGDNRSGLIQGDRDQLALPVEVVDLATWREREARREQEQRQEFERRKAALESGALSPAGPSTVAEWGQRQLGRACDKIRAAAEGKRHETIRALAWWIGGVVAARALDEVDARRELTAAAEAALPDDRHDEARELVKSGLAKGAAEPADLSRLASPRTYAELRRERLLSQMGSQS